MIQTMAYAVVSVSLLTYVAVVLWAIHYARYRVFDEDLQAARSVITRRGAVRVARRARKRGRKVRVRDVWNGEDVKS